MYSQIIKVEDGLYASLYKFRAIADMFRNFHEPDDLCKETLPGLACVLNDELDAVESRIHELETARKEMIA